MSDTSSSISVSTSSSGTQRITGLYSGMDIDAMVEASLLKEKNRIASVKQNITYQEWKKEAYQDVNTLVSDFQKKYFDYSSSSSTSLFSASALNMKKTTITGGNSNAVGISAGSTAVVKNFEILETTKATSAKLVTSSIKNADFTGITNADGKEVNENNATIRQLSQAMGGSLNTTTKYLDKDGKEVSDKSSITKKYVDAEGNEVDYDNYEGDKSKLTEKYVDADGNEVTKKDYISFNIAAKDSDGKDKVYSIEIDVDGKLSDVISAVNKCGAGITMSYNEFSKKFQIESNNTGANTNFTISGADGFFFGTNGILGSADGFVSTDGVSNMNANADVITTKAVDSYIKIVDENGDIYENTTSTNSMSVAGYTFTIRDNFDSTTAGETMKVEMSTDTEGIVDRITEFVNDYNALIKKLSDMVTERPDSDYDPLTEDEKKELSDSEIEEYEAKAKAGILFGDSNIRNLLNNMRSAFSNIKTSSGLSLRSFGIGTGSYFESDVQGELKIDEDTLKSMIETNASDFVELFTTSGSTLTSGKSASKGIGYELRELTRNYVSNAKDVTISSITTKISNYEDRLSYLEELFEKKEDDLYTKWSSVESSILEMDSYASMFYQ